MRKKFSSFYTPVVEKDEHKNNNMTIISLSCLLIHAARIDEAYTEKEIGGDSTKWDAYKTAYNKVRSDNPKE